MRAAEIAEEWGCPNALRGVQHVRVEDDKREVVCWLGNEMVTVKEGSRMGI